MTSHERISGRCRQETTEHGQAEVTGSERGGGRERAEEDDAEDDTATYVATRRGGLCSRSGGAPRYLDRVAKESTNERMNGSANDTAATATVLRCARRVRAELPNERMDISGDLTGEGAITGGN
jgi:hypothetical protein